MQHEQYEVLDSSCRPAKLMPQGNRPVHSNAPLFWSVQMRFLSKKQVCQKISLSRATVDRNVADGKFPRPMVWGFRLLFDEDEVDGWMLARKAERDRPSNTSR